MKHILENDDLRNAVEWYLRDKLGIVRDTEGGRVTFERDRDGNFSAIVVGYSPVVQGPSERILVQNERRAAPDDRVSSKENSAATIDLAQTLSAEIEKQREAVTTDWDNEVVASTDLAALGKINGSDVMDEIVPPRKPRRRG